jgi:hypothetical protein
MAEEVSVVNNHEGQASRITTFVWFSGFSHGLDPKQTAAGALLADNFLIPLSRFTTQSNLNAFPNWAGRLSYFFSPNAFHICRPTSPSLVA